MNKIFKYFSSSYWKTKNEYKEILEWIKSAKKYYIDSLCPYPGAGMCFAFIRTTTKKNYTKISNYDFIRQMIPEFNPTYLNAPKKEGYWWMFDDYESRIKAFDKLIELYKTKIKTL